MGAVDDQLGGHPRVVEQRDHRAGVAVVDGRHRVEQVGGHRRAGLDRGLRAGQVGVGVPDRGDHPGVGDGPDRRQRAGPLRRDSDHADGAGARRPAGGPARPGPGRAAAVGSWAPQRRAESHGPSRWIPAIAPSATSPPSIATPASSSTGVAVTRLASVRRRAVRPVERGGPAGGVRVGVGERAPAPAVQWMSTKPGTTIRSPRSRSGRRGGRPAPTSRIWSPRPRASPVRPGRPSPPSRR